VFDQPKKEGEKMGTKQLRKLLASLGLAGLIAGASLTLPNCAHEEGKTA
jgi:radical SAM modification target selenobiotic family peptide